MKWRNSKERELLSQGGTREQTLPSKDNQNPDLSDPLDHPGAVNDVTDIGEQQGTFTTLISVRTKLFFHNDIAVASKVNVKS